MKFIGVTILEGVEFPILIFILHGPYKLQQCSATALPVIFSILYL